MVSAWSNAKPARVSAFRSVSTGSEAPGLRKPRAVGFCPGLEQLAELLHLLGVVLVKLVPDVLAVHGLRRVPLVGDGGDVAAGVDDVEALLADLHRALLQRPRAAPLPLFAARTGRRVGRGGGELLLALAAQDLPHRATAEPRGLPDNLPEPAAPFEEPTDVIGLEEGGDALQHGALLDGGRGVAVLVVRHPGGPCARSKVLLEAMLAVYAARRGGAGAASPSGAKPASSSRETTGSQKWAHVLSIISSTSYLYRGVTLYSVQRF